MVVSYLLTTSSVGAGGRDIYMVKVDSSGNEEWYKTIGGEIMIVHKMELFI